MMIVPLRFLPGLALPCAAALSAQIVPQPSADNPRIQTVEWTAGEEYILTALPNTGLTVMLEPGEQIRRISLEDPSLVDVRVSAEGDSFLILPLSEPASTGMVVQTGRRDYRFNVQTAMTLTSAYLVSFTYAGAGPLMPTQELQQEIPQPTGQTWDYRMRGDKSVRPARISDDGVRTTIEFPPEQDLPAIFAIGPTGDEQVVNGHMRSGVFVIDRVHRKLVFRIDKDKATAQRSAEPQGDS
ncbi:hypothetical protein GCM10023115_10480 [Pontixanthobacter gangjinensis]|uniref:Type IV secretion system protein VirB9 n=1 Tax=Pontixanthobacter gangjinensis TaxID=1028742 RepID=A0A6I4SKW2_9SPHN|nr:TrbG/VirB9 family P-type conjugative transfer protein [Pontixanthobacter gangjinensis]MXO56294.1 hypothetical protein [Pontixanthobacter gangjinensis]